MRRFVSYSSLKLPDWPPAIRHLEVLRAGDAGPFGNVSPASRWSASTYELHVWNLGFFLGWLGAKELLFPYSSLANVAERATLLAYVDDMYSAGLSPKTIATRLTAIRAALGALSPEVDVGWLMKGIQRVQAQPSDRRNTSQRKQHTADLVELGMHLMRQGMVYPLEGPCLADAESFRDGLLIMFAALMVPRIGTLPVMNIGDHLARKGETYQVRWKKPEMKGGRRAHQAELPEELAGLMDFYLEVYRPVLARRTSADLAGNGPLWLNKRGTRMSYRLMYDVIVDRTEASFGVSVYPHAFRHSAASTLLLERPDLVQILTPLLQHSTEQMRETYILAGRMEAGRRYGEMMSCRRGSRHRR